jgi:outer membrane protein assembly factor BamB
MQTSLLCAFLSVFFAPLTSDTMHWSQFLGPSSHAVMESDIPLTWSSHEHVAWVNDLTGYGQSSPVIWGDVVYVSSVRGAMKETLVVTAVRLSDGDKLWEYTFETKRQSENSDYFSRAAPTPIVSDLGVVVWFENGDLIALDHKGGLRWNIDLVDQYGPIQSRHGLSSSLAAWDDRLVVWVQRDQAPYLLCLNQSAGEVIWKKEFEPGTSWSSPVLLPMDLEQSHLILSVGGNTGGPGGPRPQASSTSETNPAGTIAPPANTATPGKLIGMNPMTGETLWELSGLAGNSTPTPTLVRPGQFLIGASAGREGGPTKEAIASNGLVAVELAEGQWRARFVWRSNRATCGFCSPIAHGGLAYFVDRRGRLFGLDVASGEELFSENLGHPVWATPLGIGSRVYFVGEEGMTTVIEVDRSFKKIAFNELWKSDTPAVEENNPKSMLGRMRQYAVVAVPGTLLIRRGDQLYCLRPTR